MSFFNDEVAGLFMGNFDDEDRGHRRRSDNDVAGAFDRGRHKRRDDDDVAGEFDRNRRKRRDDDDVAGIFDEDFKIPVKAFIDSEEFCRAVRRCLINDLLAAEQDEDDDDRKRHRRRR